MARPRHLDNAPITEALIDFRVSHRDGLSFSLLQEAFAVLDFGYYSKSPISEGKIQFKLPAQGQLQTTGESMQTGLRLHSSDEKYVAQCRVSGFTLSRLVPYEEWTNLVQETRRVWSIYRDRLAPKFVTRVATRFINNLRLPLAQGDSYQKFLKKFADVPDEVPQDLAGFFQRFELVDSQSNSFVKLTVTLSPMAEPQPVSPVILDIEAFQTGPPWDPNSEDFWATLETLRELKNRCFFGSLTEEAVELYQ